MKNTTGALFSRERLGYWGSILGFTALFIGILGWLWQGVLSPIVIAALVIGAVGIALWVTMTPQAFRDFITGRQVRFGTMTVFSTLLLIGIVTLVYVVLQRSAITLDMTQSRNFTLSAETMRLLNNVTRPIQITAFYNSTAVQQREIDDQFFRLYETATNGLIHRQYINPDEEPALAQRFGAYTNGATYLSYLTAENTVDFQTLARVPRNPGGAQEREITQAVARLLQAGTLTIYFETGLGTLDPLDTSQRGLSNIHLGMQESGLLTSSFSLPQLAAVGDSIPADAAALILPGPTQNITNEELAIVDAYLQQGGSLFIMAEALFGEGTFLREESPFNAYLWENYGIRTRDAVVVDEGANVRTPLDIIGAAAFTSTEIGQRLDPAEAPTLFRIARTVEVNSDNPPVNNGRVLSSSPIGFGERNTQRVLDSNAYGYDPETDLVGPVDIAVWAWDQTTDARILLIGDSDFVTNGFVSSALGNAILFTDGLSWLSHLNEQIDFTPQAISTGLPLIFLDTATLDTIAFLTVILMPSLLLIVGGAIRVRRVRQ